MKLQLIVNSPDQMSAILDGCGICVQTAKVLNKVLYPLPEVLGAVTMHVEASNPDESPIDFDRSLGDPCFSLQIALYDQHNFKSYISSISEHEIRLTIYRYSTDRAKIKLHMGDDDFQVYDEPLEQLSMKLTGLILEIINNS